MREIKFRFWDKKDKEMSDPLSMEEISDGTRDIDNCILLQYTGLKDKNGKEIYEGDIVNYNPDRSGYIGDVRFTEGWIDGDGGYGGDAYLGWVIWNNKEKAYDNWESLLGDVKNFSGENCVEVIGNIYENPELLTNE